MTPDIAGKWLLDGTALAPDGSALYQWQAEVTIGQGPSIMLETLGERQSRSLSFAEKLTAKPDGTWHLRYGYELDPTHPAAEKYSFFGLSELTFAADLQSAEGSSCNCNTERYSVMKLRLRRELSA